MQYRIPLVSMRLPDMGYGCDELRPALCARSLNKVEPLSGQHEDVLRLRRGLRHGSLIIEL
eukprot:6848500-Prymnesium_polylepis.1